MVGLRCIIGSVYVFFPAFLSVIPLCKARTYFSIKSFALRLEDELLSRALVPTISPRYNELGIVPNLNPHIKFVNPRYYEFVNILPIFLGNSLYRG
jgi:hypothetical protein